jgi:DNA mismatch repair protein MutL
MKVNPDIIDINIHPTKTEIKFQDEQAIWQILRATVKETLAKHNIVPSLDFNNEANIEIPVFRKNAQVKPPSVKYDPAFNPFESQDRKTHSTTQSFKHDQSVKGWEELFENESSPASFVPESTSVESEPSQETISDENTGCQTTNRFFHFKGKYILTQVKSGLMIIDQKKAHERILFEKFLKTLENKQGLAQQSLYPETIELNPADYTIISDIMDDLMTIGFDIRDFGSNTVILNGVPSELRVKNGQELIESLIEEYKQTESNVKEGIHNKIALSMAKVAAIGYGIILAEQEMRELVDTLFACQMPNYSPGGGTIITILTLEELEKRFKT